MKKRTFTMPIALGSRIRDRVTGIVGTAVCYAVWKNGCNRYTVQPPVGADGKVPDSIGVDEQDVEVVEEVPVAKAKKTGGPKPLPILPMAR